MKTPCRLNPNQLRYVRKHCIQLQVASRDTFMADVMLRLSGEVSDAAVSAAVSLAFDKARPSTDLGELLFGGDVE